MNSQVIIKYPGIEGQLRVMASPVPDEYGRIHIEGDPAGLRSLAELLHRLADLDQQELRALPDSGAAEHVHLRRTDYLTPESADELVIGRLDDKQGRFDAVFVPRSSPTSGSIEHHW